MYEFSSDYNVPPLETLKELMEEYDLTSIELAEKTALSEEIIENILSNQQEINEEIAHSFESVFPVPMTFWINLQNNYNKRKKATK